MIRRLLPSDSPTLGSRDAFSLFASLATPRASRRKSVGTPAFFRTVRMLSVHAVVDGLLSLQRGTTDAMHITVARLLLLLHCMLLSLRVLLVGLLLLQR